MNLPLELSENLVKNNKIIFVEDSTATPGRGLALAQALIETQGQSLNVSTFFNEFSPLDQDLKEILTENDVQKMKEMFESTSPNNTVLLHSLTPLILENSIRKVLQLLHVLKKDDKIAALIATIHGDCHNAKEVQMLLNHSDLWLKVQSLDFDKTVMIKSHPKGKVEQTIYDIQVENGKLIGAKISSNPNVIKPVQVVEDKDDSPLPTSSFNLTLSEKEKEDRSKVELPYLRKKEAKIEYIPDENDDWDDEDPDDDLEF